jgi:hypothetical protein
VRRPFACTPAVGLTARWCSRVDSSKFQEYREVPKGVSMPVFSIQGSQNGKDFGMFARNVSRSDQRYSGYAKVGWFGVTFDYNQIPHNMGNHGRTFLTETAAGVWSMSGTLRGALGGAVDAVASTARTYPFYANLLAPTIASAGSVDISGLRERGNVTVDLGGNMPFDLTLAYMRELKSGSRGASGGDILGVVTTSVDVLEPLDEVTQDVGLRWAYNFKAGNVYATFNRNTYNDRQDSLIIDNPFRATDLAYVSTSVPGGPGQVRFSTYPDNAANRGAFGVLLKFARQTRVSADAAFGRWTQNAQFLPFTINSAVFTPAGLAANSTAALPQQSLDGKIDTTTLNVAFSSRPVENLAVRLELTPSDTFGVTLAYFRRNDDYPNRPDRIALSGGVPVAGAQPIAGTSSGLLEASYDTYTVEFDFRPSERAELNAYYTYEKYTFADAYSDGTTIFPQSGLLFLKANNGGYKANIVYTKLNYRW